MSGLTALGTTFNLPNFTGILYQLTPSDTPFFSAIGGLTGGKATTGKSFEWSNYDLRDAGQNVALEGQDAPPDQVRIRGTANNVTQIHHETTGVSYTKQAATGDVAGLNTAGKVNQVMDELDWQVQQFLKIMVRDIEYSFIRGIYQNPSDNLTPRMTRGILQAITTNVVSGGTAVPGGVGATATAGTDLIAAAGHGLAAGDQVQLSSITGAAPLNANTTYYVSANGLVAGAFKVSTTPGGAPVDITADGTVTVTKRGAVSRNMINSLLQQAYVNGGLMDTATATLLVPPQQKSALTDQYITGTGYGSRQETTRDVGGVSVSTIISDFGTLNVMLDRHMPADTIAVVSLEQCAPVYLEIPGKGHFFAEPLAKTGAKDRVQLYGEVGLSYGNERTHAKITGLSIPA
jgi:Family of unknown function (DUF5309)